MMRVHLTLDDNLMTPLIQEHLENEGKTVRSQIADAISFWLKCKEEIKKGKLVVSGDNGSYINKNNILMGESE